MIDEGSRPQPDRAPRGEDEPARGVDPDAAEAIDWQRLWLATQHRPWRSLAVIPVGAGISTVRIARSLAAVGACHLGPIVKVADATALRLDALEASLDAWTARLGVNERVLIALSPVVDSPIGLALARAADAALLCVALGESAILEATRITEEVGRGRFLGSVIVRRRRKQR